MSVGAKKQRKAEVLEGILETMETDGGVEDWVLLTLLSLSKPWHNSDQCSSALLYNKDCEQNKDISGMCRRCKSQWIYQQVEVLHNFENVWISYITHVLYKMMPQRKMMGLMSIFI